jgi:hypothetical protein
MEVLAERQLFSAKITALANSQPANVKKLAAFLRGGAIYYIIQCKQRQR